MNKLDCLQPFGIWHWDRKVRVYTMVEVALAQDLVELLYGK
jgi:hypothetical protein